MSAIRILPVLAATLLGGTALAQAPGAPPTPACAQERAYLAAEETTPGYLRDLMRQSLEICLAGTVRQAAAPTPTPPQPAAPAPSAGTGR